MYGVGSRGSGLRREPDTTGRVGETSKSLEHLPSPSHSRSKPPSGSFRRWHSSALTVPEGWVEPPGGSRSDGESGPGQGMYYSGGGGGRVRGRSLGVGLTRVPRPEHPAAVVRGGTVLPVEHSRSAVTHPTSASDDHPVRSLLFVKSSSRLCNVVEINGFIPRLETKSFGTRPPVLPDWAVRLTPGRLGGGDRTVLEGPPSFRLPGSTEPGKGGPNDPLTARPLDGH